MANNYFDTLAKWLVGAVVEQCSRMKTEHEAILPTQYVDLAYDQVEPAKLESWTGWLGRIIGEGPAMLEFYSRAPGLAQVDGCVCKHFNYHYQRELRARRQRRRVPPRPLIWLFCAGRPITALREHAARPMPDWPAGFWQSQGWPWLRLVVLRDVPVERPTLLLRLMARKRTLAQALEEVSALPSNAPERQLVNEALLGLGKQFPQDISEELSMYIRQSLREELAALKATGEQVRRELIAEGRKEGHLAGERAMLKRLLTRRFGRLPKQAITRIEAADSAELEQWGERVLEARSLAEVFD